MTLYKGNAPIAGIATNTKYNAHNILDFKWSDHEINDMSWLRADTFSWQDGTVYTEVYNKLALSVQGATTKTEQGVTFYECPNGLRVALVNQESNVLSAYNTDGVAWYYVLDTTNTRFKLPRTKYGFVGLRDEVGKFVNESLPNITGVSRHSYNNYGGTYQDGAFYSDAIPSSGLNVQGGNTGGTFKTLGFNASLSSSTYQDNAPVQQRSTQMYLYFYVGEYSQTAIEQTAGITTEQLNGKVDLNLNNMNPSATAKETIVSWGMPDYSAGINIAVPLQASPYICLTDCYMQGISAKTYYSKFYVYINNVQYTIGAGNNVNEWQSNNIYLFLPKGTSIYFTSGYVSADSLYVFPLKGVN